MEFHLDENVSEAIALGLRRRGHSVSTTPEAHLLGVTDEEQLAFALRESRIMISHDTDMLRLAAAGSGWHSARRNSVLSQAEVRCWGAYFSPAVVGK